MDSNREYQTCPYPKKPRATKTKFWCTVWDLRGIWNQLANRRSLLLLFYSVGDDPKRGFVLGIQLLSVSPTYSPFEVANLTEISQMEQVEAIEAQPNLNWSESVEDLVSAGDTDGAISLLESVVSKLETLSPSETLDLQLASALTELSKLHSTKHFSLKSDELLSRASLLKQRVLQSRPSGYFLLFLIFCSVAC